MGLRTRIAAGLVLYAAGALAAPAAHAQTLYRWVDKEGQTRITDQAPDPRELGRWLAAPGGAAESASDLKPLSAASVDALLDATGLRAQVELMTAQIRGQIPRPGATLRPEDRAAIEQAARRHFSAAAIEAALRASLLQASDVGLTGEVLAWCRSPLGRRVKEVEATALRADRAAETRRLLAEGREPQVEAGRRRLLDRLDVASRTGDTLLEISLATMRGVMRGVAATFPPEQRPDEGQMQQQAERLRAQASGRLHQAALASLFVTYRALTDAELERYVTFMESPPGRWLAGLLADGFVGATEVTAEGLAGDIVRRVPPERLRGATR